MKKIMISALLMAFAVGCASMKKNSSQVFELAINQSNSGQHTKFLETRKAFVDLLAKEDAVKNEGKWTPFFTVDKSINLKTVLGGMTEWRSMKDFGIAAQKLLPTQEAKDYFSSFKPLTYVLLETIDGKKFDMESIKMSGNVVEFALRRAKKQDTFGSKRDIFFNSLEKYDGYKFAREFRVYKLGKDGIPKLAENTQAVIIVWEDAKSFQAAATPVFKSQEYNNFARELDVESYFATFPTK